MGEKAMQLESNATIAEACQTRVKTAYPPITVPARPVVHVTRHGGRLNPHFTVHNVSQKVVNCVGFLSRRLISVGALVSSKLLCDGSQLTSVFLG